MLESHLYRYYEFYLLESLILDHKSRNGYDYEQHIKYATQSSGSPITLELQLFITLCLCSGATYLDMIWYGVSLKSIREIYWSTICDIDEAVGNINFSDTLGVMKLVNNWSKKHKDHHGFTANMGTALALDGFVIVIKKVKCF